MAKNKMPLDYALAKLCETYELDEPAKIGAAVARFIYAHGWLEGMGDGMDEAEKAKGAAGGE